MAALVLASTGVGWAVGSDQSNSVITACANADQTLSLSTSGSCPPGSTLVQWNQQGPQGLEGSPGQQGPSGTGGGVVAWGPSEYKNGFSIRGEIDKPGKYWLDGSVYLKLNAVHNDRVASASVKSVTLTPSCHLLTGPENGGASEVANWSNTWWYHPYGQSWLPPLPFSGQVDATSDVLEVTNPPLELYFSCKVPYSTLLHRWVSRPMALWQHPTIEVETYTPPSLPGKLIGPALPNKPRIPGPGPIERVFAGG
ncbi:MAG TPA: hypothetical protein VGF09_07070 [Solirubrobacterales bacterium]